MTYTRGLSVLRVSFSAGGGKDERKAGFLDGNPALGKSN